MNPCIFLPAVAYAMVFLWTSIVPTVEMPQLFPVIWGLDTEQNGLQMISIIVGSLIGEQIGGFMSDKWMAQRRHRQAKKTGMAGNVAVEDGGLPASASGEGLVAPEYRLWLAYIGYALSICGFVVFSVQIANASNKWNVTPLIGAAIGAAGNQIVTTINITYAVDCYRVQAASVGVFITFVRQTWGFIGPFW